MIQQDSILEVIATRDSILMSDNIYSTYADTAISHTLFMIPSELTTGFMGILHPTNPQTENWVFPVLVGLFLVLSISIKISSAYVTETLNSFFKIKERTSIFTKTTTINNISQTLLMLFSCSVFTLYLYLFLQPATEGFPIIKFIYMLSATVVFFIVKYLLTSIIGFVFFNPGTFKIAKENYINLISFFGVILFPILILRIYANENYVGWLNIIATVIFLLIYILITYKFIQIFFVKLSSLFYILLYLCTLEILPLIILFRVYIMIV